MACWGLGCPDEMGPCSTAWPDYREPCASPPQGPGLGLASKQPLRAQLFVTAAETDGLRHLGSQLPAALALGSRMTDTTHGEDGGLVCDFHLD